MFWLPFLLVGILTQVARTIFVKKVGGKIDPIFATFGRFLFMPVFSGIGILFLGLSVKDPQFWLNSILGGIGFAISQIFVSLSVIRNNATITTAFFSTNVILVLILESVFLNEKFGINQVLGIVIAILAIVYITLTKDKNLNFKQSLAQFEYKSLAIGWLIYPFAKIFQKKAVLLSNPATTTFINNISSVTCLSIILIIYYFKFNKTSKAKVIENTKTHLKEFILLGLFGYLSVLAYNYATQFISATIASTITQLEIPLTMLYAYFFLGEKDLIRKNLLPILALLVGIVMVVWK
jgi:drug/metabolite transporter (DMT)-like permease